MKAYVITKEGETKYWKFLSTVSKHYGTSYPMLARKSREAESFEYDGLKVELIEVENAFTLNGQIIKIED